MIGHLYNNSKLKLRRRSLRKNQTGVEGKLWNKLRCRQLLEHKFYRQYSVGSYILDFYCPAKKLGIEIDGGQHLKIKNEIYDNRRTEYLKSKGIKIVRFWNNEINQNLAGVIETITRELAGS